MEYDNVVLRSEDEINKFRQRVQEEGWIMEKTPWFVPSKDALQCGYVPEDMHMRLYQKSGAERGIRAIYSPELEWESSQVKHYH